MPARDRRRERFSDRDQQFGRAWRGRDEDEPRRAPREERAFGGYPDYDRDRRAREEARGRDRDYEAGERSASYPGAYGWRGQHHEDEAGAPDDPENGARGPGSGHYGGQQPYAGQGDYGQGPYGDRPYEQDRYGRHRRRDDSQDPEDLARRARPHFGQGQYGQGQYGHEQGTRAERYGGGGHGEGRTADDEAFDEDYRQWRSAQMRSLDEDYRAWRAERSERFADDFESWRRERRKARDNEEGAAAGSSGGGEEDQRS